MLPIITRFPVDWVELLKACCSMSKPSSPHENLEKYHAYELLCIIITLQMPGKNFLSSHMMKHSFHIGTLPQNDIRCNVDATF